MIIEPIKPVEEWTVEDWRSAFNTQTELYNAATARAARLEARIEDMRDKFHTAIEATMNLYATASAERVIELEREVKTLTTECNRLRMILAAYGRTD